ncbi:MAG: glycosyltransferase [Bacteroidales bacterium]|nr:glycosyltransferase [Bacteroidales bacterium]
MIENRNIIVFGLQPFDVDIGSTCKYTAIELSKKNNILFVNYPLNRKNFLLDRKNPMTRKRLRIIKGKEPELEKINDRLWVLYPRTIIESINWINSPKIFDFFNKINEKRFAYWIKKAIKKLNFKDYIIFNDNSMIIGYYLKELLKPEYYIYLLRDAVTEVAYHKKHGQRLEKQLISKVDLVVTNSYYFENYAKQFNSNSHMIGQGCDLTMYNDKDGKITIPEELQKIIDLKKPIIGYTGVLTALRLDIDILVHIAKTLTDWNLVLVGPEEEEFVKSELHNLKNVFFLGRKDPEQLPGYIKGFDVAINPQKINKITDINYPLKIDEYLAMGKPAVATKTTFMSYFKGYVYLPSNKEEYIKYLKLAIEENTPEKAKQRIAFASTHSWKNFVDKIYNYIEELENKKNN